MLCDCRVEGADLVPHAVSLLEAKRKLLEKFARGEFAGMARQSQHNPDVFEPAAILHTLQDLNTVMRAALSDSACTSWICSPIGASQQ